MDIPARPPLHCCENTSTFIHMYTPFTRVVSFKLYKIALVMFHAKCYFIVLLL